MPNTEAIERPTLTSPVGGHTREEKLAAFGRLLDIMDDLREGCPWDRKQTFESLQGAMQASAPQRRSEMIQHHGVSPTLGL